MFRRSSRLLASAHKIAQRNKELKGVPPAVKRSMRLKTNMDSDRPTHDRNGFPLMDYKTYAYGYVGNALRRDMTVREERVSELTERVFSLGNRFIKNCIELRTIPIGKLSFPEVILVGHTNSGKSTLLGTLLHNRRLGRPGTMRGSTKALGFFSVGDSFMVIDSPGYGFWDKKHKFGALSRSRGQCITKQYVSLRKHTNLKRVYVCVAADVGLMERDLDFIRFLLTEAVPFTIVLTQLDMLAHHDTRLASEFNWQEVLAEIPKAAQKVFDRLGTDQVPLIEVCCRNGYNIESLQKDMVFQCCQELKDDELDIDHLQQLSYSPASAAAYIEAEGKFPPHFEILINRPDEPLLEFIEAHKDKLRFEAQLMPKVLGQYSLYKFANQQAPNVGAAHYEVEREEPVKALQAPAEFAPVPVPVLEEKEKKLLIDSEPEGKSSSLVTPPQLAAESGDAVTTTTTAAPINYGEPVRRDAHADDRPASSAVLLVDETNPRKMAALAKLPPPEAPPLSIQQDSVVAALGKMDKSAQRYKRLIENGWEQVLQKEDWFYHDEEALEEQRKQSGRREQNRKMLHKYIDHKGVHEERALRLDAHGFWNPFVGNNDAAGSTVKGAGVPASSGATAAGGRGVNYGGRMLGLKQKGFGHRSGSYAPHTFKGKGRASWKLDKWAR